MKGYDLQKRPQVSRVIAVKVLNFHKQNGKRGLERLRRNSKDKGKNRNVTKYFFHVYLLINHNEWRYIFKLATLSCLKFSEIIFPCLMIDLKKLAEILEKNEKARAGIVDILATEIAVGLRKIIVESVLKEVATKDDIKELRSEIKETENKLRNEIKESEERLKKI